MPTVREIIPFSVFIFDLDLASLIVAFVFVVEGEIRKPSFLSALHLLQGYDPCS